MPRCRHPQEPGTLGGQASVLGPPELLPLPPPLPLVPLLPPPLPLTAEKPP